MSVLALGTFNDICEREGLAATVTLPILSLELELGLKIGPQKAFYFLQCKKVAQQI